MPTFDIDRERINVFPIDDAYYFAHYFERTDLFEAISAYYDDETYRFEVPAADFEPVRSRLEEAYYELVIVEDMGSFCVVMDPYTPHAQILKRSVMNWRRRDKRFFLLKDELSVREAVEQGAAPIADTEYVLGL